MSEFHSLIIMTIMTKPVVTKDTNRYQKTDMDIVFLMTRKACSLRLLIETSVGITMAPELQQDVWRDQKSFQLLVL